MKLDFDKFHKVECDDKCTMLQHPSGHLIKIAHNSLSPEHKKELEALPMKMAKGGKITYKQMMQDNFSGASKAAGASKGSNPGMPEAAYTPPKMAKDAYTEPDNLGTQPYEDVVLKALHKEMPPMGAKGAEKPHYPPCINSSCKSFGRSHPNCRCYGGNPLGKPHGEMPGMFAEGGEVESYCSSNKPHQKGCEYFAEGGKPQMPEAPVEAAPEAAAPPMTNEQELQSELNNYDKTADRAVASENPEVPMSQPQGMPMDNAELQPKTKAQQAQEVGAKVAQHLVADDAAVKSDINAGHITPKTYSDLFHDKSTLSKIGALFGIMVGGAGAGLGHTTNAATDMMDKIIQNDLRSQESSESNRQKLIKLNQENLANNAGIHLTDEQANQLGLTNEYMMKNRAALDYITKMSGKLPEGSPQRAQGDQMLAILSQGVDKKNMSIASQAAMALALSHMANGGGNTMIMKSGMMGPEFKEMGNDIEQKTIPGIPGRANRPIEQKDRDQVQAMSVLSDKANDLMKFAKAHHGTLSPSQRAIAAQKAEEMVNFYNNSIQGGVLTQGRLKWLDEQISKNPTGVVTQLLGNQQRLQEIKSSNDHRRDLLLQTYGYNKSKGSAPAQQSSAETKTMNGAQYTRVAGGWKKLK